jgi:hypothetical protein
VADKRLAELRKIGRTAGRPTPFDHAYPPAAQPESIVEQKLGRRRGSELAGLGAFSGKVGTGFPQKMRPIKNLDRFPIQLNRKAI